MATNRMDIPEAIPYFTGQLFTIEQEFQLPLKVPMSRKILHAWLVSFLIVTGAAAQTLDLTHAWQVVFEEDLAKADVLNHWQLINGKWSLTPEGLKKEGDGGDGELMLRLPAMIEGLRVEYRAKSGAKPGDLSLVLGTEDGSMDAAVYAGVGSGDNTGCKLVVKGREVARNADFRLKPGAWHDIAVEREGGVFRIEVDGQKVLEGPDSRDSYFGRYLALYAWNEAVFGRIRVTARLDDKLYAYLRAPWDWRFWRIPQWGPPRITELPFNFTAFAHEARLRREQAACQFAESLRSGFTVRPQDSWVVYGYAKRHSAMPSMIARRDGSFAAVFSGDRTYFDGPDGKLFFMTSPDGQRWNAPALALDTVLDDRDPGLIELPDGALLLTWTATDDCLDEEAASVYPHWVTSAWRAAWKKIPEADRRAARGHWLAVSADGGKTWGQRAPTPVGAPHGPALLRDGRLLLMGRETAGARRALSVFESKDKGRTWNRLWTRDLVFDLDRHFNNAHVLETADGRLVAMVGHDKPVRLYRDRLMAGSDRRQNFGEFMAGSVWPAGGLWQLDSRDGGTTWTPPRLTAMYGNWPQLMAATGSTLVCTYAHHGAPFGPRASVSTDGGVTWDTDHELVLRADSPSAQPGSPCSARLANGRMLTFYSQPWYESLRPSAAFLSVTLWNLPDKPNDPPVEPALRTSPASPETAAAIAQDRKSGTPFLEIADVLVGDRRAHYRIPSLVVTPKGAVLVFANRRIDTVADEAQENDIVMSRSLDGGRTWETPRDLFSREGWAATIGTAIVDDSNGRIMLDYTRRPAFDHVKETERRAGDAPEAGRFLAISDDEGLTWRHEKPVVEPNPQGRTGYTHGCGHGITLKLGKHKGRLVIPAIMSARTTNDHYAGSVIYSDDRGQTWKTGGTSDLGTDETCVAELADGALHLNSRIETGGPLPPNRRRWALSFDGGLTFPESGSDAILTEHFGGCNGSVQRLPDADGGGNRLLFSNPAVLSAVEKAGGAGDVRRWMTVRLSYDGGKTWPVARRIYRGMSAYSSLGVLPDGTILCGFERGVELPYERIAVARFNLPWLTGGMQ